MSNCCHLFWTILHCKIKRSLYERKVTNSRRLYSTGAVCPCTSCCTATPTHWVTMQRTMQINTRMPNAQRDGRPAEYRWRPLLNAAVWLTPTTRVPCSNAAKTQNLLKLPGVPQTNEMISAASGPKFTILWGHVEEILLLNRFLSDCRYMP